MYNFTRILSYGAVADFAQNWETASKPPTRYPNPTCKTFIRVVKLTVIILLAGLLQVSARTSAQQRISLTLKGATLDKIFTEIEKRSGYTVFYNTDVLKSAGLVSVDIKDATVEEVLRQCLKGLPLEFKIQDKTIFVKKDMRHADLESGSWSGGTPTVSGIVNSESGTPLGGATVFITKLNRSAVTNAQGVFSLKEIPDGEFFIEISYIGYERYKTKITVVDHAAFFTVHMKQSMDKLDETVVKGYYRTTNRLNTGDVTTVMGEDIAKQPVTDVILGLEARVPGLYIQQASGIPGAYSTIRIRGQNSILNGNYPLYIVDGVPYSGSTLTSSFVGGGAFGPGSVYGATGASPFNFLDPANIETIEVLKDADATAIYGSRGANGVILINTKKGKAGHTRFDLNALSGIGKVTRMLDLLNTQQYLEMRHEAFQNDRLAPKLKDYDINGTWDTTRYTNWQKTLIGNGAQFTNVEGNLSGGDVSTQFIIGGGYSKQGVVYPGDYSDQKISVHAGLTHVSFDQRLHLQMNVNYVNDNSNLPQTDYTTTAITLAPDAPALYDANGNLNWQVQNGTSTWTNPLGATRRKSTAMTNNLISSLNMSYLLFPGFHLKSNVGYNYAEMNQTSITPAASYGPPNNNSSTLRSYTTANTAHSTWIFEPQAEYEKRIEDGQFDILIGTTFQQNTVNATGLIASGFTSDALISDPLAASTKSPNGYNNILYKYDAIFGRINYDWQDKYLINATARRDGSSRFGPGKQFGNFGAVGVGWIFSRESFIQRRLSFLSFGKLRGSYGTTGNDQITDYQFLSTYTPNSPSYEGLTGLYPTSLPNPYFGWESVKKLEGSIELGFLSDKILLSASYYRDRTGNQLVGYPLPLLTGFSSVQANLPAIVQNSGAEFTFTSTNISTKNFKWTSSLNLTIPKNKLVAYPNLSTSTFKNRFALGESIFIQKVFQYLGVNDTTGVVQFASKAGPTSNPAYPGDLITSKPVTQQLYGGFENRFIWKGFQLDFLIQFVKQRSFNYFYYEGFYGGINNFNMPTVVLNRWRKTGDISNYPKFSTNYAGDPNSDISSSTFEISDASFIRLKNIALSYQLPGHVLSKAHLENLRVFIQCQNLFTITKFLGEDPESGPVGLPPLKMVTAGIQATL